MEQKYISIMENDSEKMQPKDCVKRNDLKLIKTYWDQEKTKLRYQYHVDQFGREQGEYKSWFEDGQIAVIANLKDGKLHRKYQDWWMDAEMASITTQHFKKTRHGTRVYFYFGYEK